MFNVIQNYYIYANDLTESYLTKISDMATNSTSIPEEVLALLDAAGFEKAVYSNLKTQPRVTCLKDAYDFTAEVFFSHFGYARYSGYVSFMTARNNRMRRDRLKRVSSACK